MTGDENRSQAKGGFWAAAMSLGFILSVAIKGSFLHSSDKILFPFEEAHSAHHLENVKIRTSAEEERTVRGPPCNASSR